MQGSAAASLEVFLYDEQLVVSDHDDLFKLYISPDEVLEGLDWLNGFDIGGGSRTDRAKGGRKRALRFMVAVRRK